MRVACVGLAILCSSAWLHAAESVAPPALSADEQAIVDQTNAQRQRAGLRHLKPNAVLFDVARKHAEAMAKAQKLEHRLNGKNSADRVDAAGYKWTTVSENIAWNQRNVAEVMSGWMHSEGHRTNLLSSDIDEIGVGIARNSLGELYWVQVFARPEAAQREWARTDTPQARANPPAVRRPESPGTTIKFSIRNEVNEALNIDVHADRLFVLKPGESETYALTSPTPKPSIVIQCGKYGLEFNAQNSAHYSISKDSNGMALSQTGPETP